MSGLDDRLPHRDARLPDRVSSSTAAPNGTPRPPRSAPRSRRIRRSPSRSSGWRWRSAGRAGTPCPRPARPAKPRSASRPACHREKSVGYGLPALLLWAYRRCGQHAQVCRSVAGRHRGLEPAGRNPVSHPGAERPRPSDAGAAVRQGDRGGFIAHSVDDPSDGAGAGDPGLRQVQAGTSALFRSGATPEEYRGVSRPRAIWSGVASRPTARRSSIWPATSAR